MIHKEKRFIDFSNVKRKQSFLSKCVPNYGDWERAPKNITSLNFKYRHAAPTGLDYSYHFILPIFRPYGAPEL